MARCGRRHRLAHPRPQAVGAAVGGEHDGRRRPPNRTCRNCLRRASVCWIFLAVITSLFGLFITAYYMRMGHGHGADMPLRDWTPCETPVSCGSTLCC